MHIPRSSSNIHVGMCVCVLAVLATLLVNKLSFSTKFMFSACSIPSLHAYRYICTCIYGMHVGCCQVMSLSFGVAPASAAWFLDFIYLFIFLPSCGYPCSYAFLSGKIFSAFSLASVCYQIFTLRTPP